jgi:hypothetical protein
MKRRQVIQSAETLCALSNWKHDVREHSVLSEIVEMFGIGDVYVLPELFTEFRDADLSLLWDRHAIEDSTGNLAWKALFAAGANGLLLASPEMAVNGLMIRAHDLLRRVTDPANVSCVVQTSIKRAKSGKPTSLKVTVHRPPSFGSFQGLLEESNFEDHVRLVCHDETIGNLFQDPYYTPVIGEVRELCSIVSDHFRDCEDWIKLPIKERHCGFRPKWGWYKHVTFRIEGSLKGAKRISMRLVDDLPEETGFRYENYNNRYGDADVGDLNFFAYEPVDSHRYERGFCGVALASTDQSPNVFELKSIYANPQQLRVMIAEVLEKLANSFGGPRHYERIEIR